MHFSAFNKIDGAYLLMLSRSDSTDISLVLALIGFEWLHMAGSNYQSILYHKIQSICVSVCMSVRSRLPNHAYYGDETFTGESMGL